MRLWTLGVQSSLSQDTDTDLAINNILFCTYIVQTNSGYNEIILFILIFVCIQGKLSNNKITTNNFDNPRATLDILLTPLVHRASLLQVLVLWSTSTHTHTLGIVPPNNSGIVCGHQPFGQLSVAFGRRILSRVSPAMSVFRRPSNGGDGDARDSGNTLIFRWRIAPRALDW